MRNSYIAAALSASLLAGGAWAADQIRDRDRIQLKDQTGDLTKDQDRLRLQIHKDLRSSTALSDADIEALDPEIKQYAKRNANREQFRLTVREALQNDCRGECLQEAVRMMNRAMMFGANEKEARKMVGDTVREQKRDREQKRLRLSDRENGDRLRLRMEERLSMRDRAREQVRERDQTGTGTQVREQDRVRERAQDAQQQQQQDQQQEQQRNRQGPGGN